MLTELFPNQFSIHQTAVGNWAAKADVHDEKSSAAAPLHVVYLLRSCSDGHETQWYTLDDETSLSHTQERFPSEATLIVPVALHEQSGLFKKRESAELPAEEITVVA